MLTPRLVARTILCVWMFTLTLTTPSHAARCGGDFNTFVQNISAEAQAAGISPSVTSAALSGVQQDMAGFSLDRRHPGPFHHSFHFFFFPPVPPAAPNTRA